MAVGSIKRWVGLWSLVGALAGGACGDDDELAKDAGSSEDGGEEGAGASEEDAAARDDGGEEEAAVEGVMCGGETCSGHSILGMVMLEPGCAESALGDEVCGLSSQLLLMGAEPKFLEKNAPGAESTSCGERLDAREEEPDGGAVDGGPKGNGRVDLSLVGRVVSLPGCCTKKGVCSADFSNGKLPIAGVLVDLNAGLGCMDPAVLFREQAEETRSIPCDPETGAVAEDADAGADAGAGDAG